MSSARRDRARRALLALLVAAPLVVFPAVGFGDHDGPAVPGPATFSQQLSRILSARVHHTRLSVVRNTNARRIGRSLAGLRPTWVSGLIRYAKGQHPVHAEVRAWREITRIVRAANPQAGFDVTLNAKQYRDGDEIQRMMQRIRSELDNDGWFFDFFSTAYRKRPRMIRAAIASAHAHGEWIGGNVFGLPKKRPLPLRADFLAVQDFHHLTLNLPAIRRVAARVPVVYHLNNDPDNPRSGGCRFTEDFNTDARRKFIRHRAKQQARNGFRVSYPVLFPECKRHSRRRGGFIYSYNAFRDPPMDETILNLLNLYD
ncbi:MAG TPA: hypothetical protein VID76_09005 [Solirubrobacterales bacterium]|jgi:hypothetical protein